MKSFKSKIIFLSLNLLLLSCDHNIKFEKSGWLETDDPDGYANRENMLNDLISNHKLKGLKYSEIIDLLGPPENYENKNSNIISYNIVLDFGHDIDPVYTKDLDLEFSKDSIVQDFKLVENKH
jgi:uncharacterized membrane protein